MAEKCETCGDSKEIKIVVPMKMSGSISSVPDFLHKPCPDCQKKHEGDLVKELKILAVNLKTSSTFHRVAPICGEAAARIEELEGALGGAVEVIKVWHGMGESHKDVAESAWQLYYKNAPEMKPINAALGKEPK